MNAAECTQRLRDFRMQVNLAHVGNNGPAWTVRTVDEVRLVVNSAELAGVKEFAGMYGLTLSWPAPAYRNKAGLIRVPVVVRDYNSRPGSAK